MPRATATRILVLAVAGGILADVVVPGNAAGLNAPILIGLLLVAALVVAGRDGLRRMDPADEWLGPASLVLAAIAAVRADPWLVTADLLFAAALAAGAIAALGGGRITRGVVPQVLAVAAGVVAASFVGAAEVLAGLRRVPVPAAADGAAGADGEGPATRTGARAALRRLVRRSAPVFRGLAVAIPLVVLFAALFASADAVFERLVRGVLEWRIEVDLTGVADRALVVTLVAWAAAGLLALAGSRLSALAGARWPSHAIPAGRSLGAAAAGAMTGRSRVGTVEATTVLAALDALFAVFVVLQVAYLFGGRDTLGAAGLTYAAYARRGFFELVVVAALAGTIVVALDLAVGRRSRAQLAAALGLLGLTGIVLASAFARLRLYQDAYGWTELRFVVLVAIGWLAVAVLVTVVLLATRRTRWTLHVLGIVVLVTIGGMNVVGPQAFVAERNLERALDPRLVPPGGRTGLDAAYLTTLGDEAVPAVVRTIDRLPDPADRAALERFLDRRAAALRTDPALQGWPAWNVTRERARTALAERAARPPQATRRRPPID